jgi:hypothetical protein
MLQKLSIPFVWILPSLGLATNLSQGSTVKTGQVQDNATWSFGRHTITFGGEFFQQALHWLNTESLAQQTGPNPFGNAARPLSQTTFHHNAVF